MRSQESAAPSHHGFRPRRSVWPVAAAMVVAFLTGSHAQSAPDLHGLAAGSTPVWSTQLDFDNNGTAWSESSFAALAADGMTNAEINMSWSAVEPSAGTFSYTELDQELANAAAAGVKLVPIFWQAGWGGSPAPWINDFEVGSSGTQSTEPAWWDSTEQSEYFAYVTDTIGHIAGEAGYGGSILNYGYLDAQWDLNGAGGGWAAADITEFQNTYLPQTYGTIAAFNTKYGTSYTAFSQVPAAAPGQALAGVFQAFRAWSVQQTYGQLTADVRAVTANTPLYYYFGGGFGNATNYANNPDTFFQLAKQYTVTVIVDSAGSPGLTLTFGSLARAYGVQLMQEWTAPSDNSQLAAQAVQWLSNYAMGMPEGGGEDFFIHDGTQKDVVGFPIYTSWLPTLKSLSGAYPQQPAAVYIDFSQGYGNTAGGGLNNVQNELGTLWQDFQAGFAVVTSQEVANGAASLSQYKAILPLNGVDANLTSYQSGGGTLLTTPEQLTQYATAYAQLDNSGILQTVPAVSSSHTSASITLADVTSGTAYNDPVEFSPAGLGLNSGSYHLVNAATGAAVAQTSQANGEVCAAADLGAATLQEWTMVAGAAPAGTASSSCPTTSGVGASSVTATAGQSGGDLQFLGVGQTNTGADGNLTQITQAGVPAVETWTSAQSGVGGAYVYLQIDPVSAVEAASNVTLQVTYWATAGQGFQPQYDGTGNAYTSGPSVTSPGTGTWTTAAVQLTGTQFDEGQNGGADLRLQVTAPSTPLIMQSVTISATGSSGSPTLAASPSAASFGNQAVGTTSAAKTVTISNTGTAAASVSGISVSGPFAQTNSCGTSIAAGGNCTISVTFTPTSGGSATGTLAVAGNAVNSPTDVALSGTGITAATNLALGASMSATSSASGFPASNANDGNTSTYWESLDGSAYPQSLTTNLGQSSSVGSVTLTLPPSSAWSTRTETLSVLGSGNGTSWTTLVPSAGYTFNPSTGNTVSINLPSGSNYQYLELTFTGNTGWSAAQVSEFEIFPGTQGTSGSATLTASATSLSFGNQPVNSGSAAQSVTVSNTGTAAASISSINTAAPFAQTNTCGATLAAGASCTASLTFAPTVAQAYNGTLTVSSNASDASLTVSLSGTGTSGSGNTTNLALNAPITASSYTQTYVAANADDGNTSTYWESAAGAYPATLTADLGTAHAIGSVVIDLPPSAAWSTRTQTLSVLGSTDDSTWTTLVGSATYTWNPSTGNTVTIALPSGADDRYVRLSITANSVQNAGQVSELEVFG